MTSVVEIFDMQTEMSRVLATFDMHVEAPNWTQDNALIVNSGGRLYRINLDAPDMMPIETGRHDRLNNDHGPSPDGAMLAFSDKVETGKSCIYVMPFSGGAAKRVTRNVPSWFHAWHPNGDRVLYPCVRDGQFAIATSTLDGAEQILIQGPGHYDGPDYTPDGSWIWFNSDRGGDMALWRMRADGSAPEQMTDGSRVDWFPHPAPDGKQVVYLSYEAGTQGHPAGRHVELRCLPAEGGEPRRLVSLYGGQGTLNVPSWSPDGRYFAFVRYVEGTLG